MKLIKRMEYLLSVFCCFLAPLHRCLAFGRPSILIVDGFLIGDGILLRPLLIALVERYEKTHDIFVISGNHSEYIYSDLSSRITIIDLQFPWCVYDYSFKRIFKLFALWLKLFFMNIEIALEPRGDFRNVAWTSLACPKQLIGFNFTGGDTLLTTIVPDNGEIVHLFEHTSRLGAVLGLSVKEDDMIMKPLVQKQNKKFRIGISFAGSQPLKSYPEELGLALLNSLADLADCEIWYILAPQENVYTIEKLEQKLKGKVQYFKGNFEQYFNFIMQLSCYIGMDSGGGHLCSMFGIPSVIIFGTQEPSYCRPVGNHPLLCVESSLKLDCRPCDGVTCTNSRYLACLHNINSKVIIDFVKIVLSKNVLFGSGVKID